MNQQIACRHPQVRALRFDLSCPRCGQPVHLVNSAPPTDFGYRTTAIVRCTRRGCPEWQIVVEMVTCGTPPPLPANPPGAA